MYPIHQYFLEKYNPHSPLVIRKTKILINIIIVLLIFCVFVFGAHILGKLPWFVLLSDFLLIISGLLGLYLIKIGHWHRASSFIILMLAISIFVQLPLRDWLNNQPQTHLRFLETLTLLIGCLSLISLFAYRSYQIFLFTLIALGVVFSHFAIIVYKYGHTYAYNSAFADLVIYSTVLLCTGYMANYMFELQENLIVDLEQESSKVRDLNNTLQIKVEARTYELETRNQELVKANFELDKFVYSISHDLRSPLVSALGLVALMREETEVSSLQYYVQMIDKLLIRLDDLVKDILDISINSRQENQKEVIDFRRLIDEAFDSHKFGHRLRHIQKMIHVDQKSIFYSDRRRLSILFNNLISNAIKYSSEEIGDNAFVKVQVVADKSGAEIVIEDNGEGIGEESIDKIFDMFYRATSNSHGSGLGLYIVKESLHKIGGKIEVKSQLGKGTYFRINVPNEYEPDFVYLPPIDKNPQMKIG
jgi:signal transduction histidine kinase